MIDLDAAIDQWIRTVRLGRVIHKCGSIEGHYRPALGEVELLEEPPQAVMPIDIRLGWRVEFGWRQIPSVRTRLLLSWHYVRNRPLDEAARKAKLEKRRAQFELQMGRAEIRRSLMRG